MKRKKSLLSIISIMFYLVLVIMPNLSFAQDQKNYLPPGCTSPKGGENVFYDMYFDADIELNGVFLQYRFTGGDIPNLQPNDIIFHGDYESGCLSYCIDEVDDSQKDIIRVKVHYINVTELLPNQEIEIDIENAPSLYTVVENYDGTVEKYTTDERFYNKHKHKYPNLQLQTVAKDGSINVNLPTLDLVKSNILIYDGAVEAEDGGNSGELELTLKTINFTYHPVVQFGYTGSGTNLTEAHVILTSSDDMQVSADAEIIVTVASDYLDWEKEKKLKKITKRVIFGYGWVKCTIALYGVIQVNATGSGYVQAGLQVDIPHEFGVTWDETNGWDKIANYTFNPSLYNSDPASSNGHPTYGLTGTITAEVRIEPRLSVHVYDIAGPTVIPVAYTKIDLNYDSNTNFSWAATAGLKASVEFNLGIPAIGVEGLVYSQFLFDYPLLKFPATDADGSPGGDAYGSAGGGSAGNQPGIADDDIGGYVYGTPDEPIPAIGIPNLISPENNAYTDNMIPVFSWSSVSGADKYQISIRNKHIDYDRLFEITTNEFTPAYELPAMPEAEWKVRAYKAGRYGIWSDYRRLDIALNMEAGNSYYGKLYLGQSVTVTNPNNSEQETFIVTGMGSNHIDIDCSGDGSTKTIGEGGAELSSNNFMLYVPIVFQGTYNKFCEIAITPYFFPNVSITAPIADQSVNSNIVRVECTYAGKDIVWEDCGNPPADADEMKTLKYDDDIISPHITTAEFYHWNLSGANGERTMTVTITDMLGGTASKDVIVDYDSSIPSFYYARMLSWTTHNGGQPAGCYDDNDNYRASFDVCEVGAPNHDSGGAYGENAGDDWAVFKKYTHIFSNCDNLEHEHGIDGTPMRPLTKGWGRSSWSFTRPGRPDWARPR